MCGVAGFINLSGIRNKEEMERLGMKMLDKLSHRGPDDHGLWMDAEKGVVIGHRRLSILDLSPAGHQPMCSACGRYVISFNGEVYNFMDIKKELEDIGAAPSWRGRSDSEVILAAINRWGIQDAVKRFNGMFAIVLFDRKLNKLHLVRDRIGKKPLYYGNVGSIFYFASELKALRSHDNFYTQVDRAALALYLQYGYIPAPYSIYKGIRKLEAGKLFTLDLSSRGEPREEQVVYWSARDMVLDAQSHHFKGSAEEASCELEKLLIDAVSLRMLSDVPLGAFLSGGIDSSMVVALMQKLSTNPVRTFSIGFQEEGFNEAQYAKKVASHLGTDHTEFYVSPSEARDVIPKLPTLFDEPFSDSSQIPTFLISELTRKYVTVSLSGDAGDELFAGYGRYRLVPDIWGKIKYLPYPLRRMAALSIRTIPGKFFNIFSTPLKPILKQYGNQGTFTDKFLKIAKVLDMRDAESLYSYLVSVWDNPGDILSFGTRYSTILSDRSLWPNMRDTVHNMMFLDLVTYLPDDIMVKVDRASMGAGLEARAPFLDHRVVKLAWSLPMSMKVHEGKSKWILRKVLNKYVPAHLTERPKMGFGIPIDSWLRGPLRGWAQSLLDFERIEKEGFFKSGFIRSRWEDHVSGKRNWQHSLWNVLMFEAWKEEWM